MPRITPLALLAVLCTPMACTDGVEKTATPPADSAFAALQERGKAAMGVDQYTSAHVFESLPDGGRIILQTDSVDPVGATAIRTHMRDIAARFAIGDFGIPGMVHSQAVPGAEEMSARRSSIRYITDTVPRGGEVRIIATDSLAVTAIHAFLAFQRMDHRIGDHHP